MYILIKGMGWHPLHSYKGMATLFLIYIYRERERENGGGGPYMIYI